MKLVALAFAFLLVACQTVQEKNALLLKDRVDKLRGYQRWHSLRCEVETSLSAPQAAKYRQAFSDEAKLLDDWNVKYDWTARHSRCEVHAQPLTPLTANQRTFVENAFCRLLQVFWVHSPFENLKVNPKDMIDQDNYVFLRQKPESEYGIYVDKKEFNVLSKSQHTGQLSAHYQQKGASYLPTELKTSTPTYTFVLKDFEWSEESDRIPPKSFWIYLGELGEPPVAHTKVEVKSCK